MTGTASKSERERRAWPGPGSAKALDTSYATMAPTKEPATPPSTSEKLKAFALAHPNVEVRFGHQH